MRMSKNVSMCNSNKPSTPLRSLTDRTAAISSAYSLRP